MAVLDWLQQLLGGGQQADPAARAVDRPYDFDQAYQPPLRPPSPTVAEAYDTAMGLTGIPDMQQAYQAYQRGEYLPALGQGTVGALNAAGIALPALKAVGPISRTIGPLLGDEVGAIGNLGSLSRAHRLAETLREPKFPQYAEEYPPVGPPEIKTDKNTGKVFEGKLLTPDAKAFQKERVRIMQDIEANGLKYPPYFDTTNRSYVDPANYPGPNTDTSTIYPKTAEKRGEYGQVIDSPETMANLYNAYQKGKTLGDTDDWYAMQGLEQKYIGAFGEEEGRKRFLDEFAVPMATTTSGQQPRDNLMMAHYLEYIRKRGEPIPPQNQLPYPVGGQYAQGNLDDYAKARAAGGYPGLAANTPKMHDFARSMIGDMSHPVMDDQMAAGMVSQGGPGFANRARGIAYGNLAQPVVDLAASEGISPGRLQGIGWAGFRDSQGLPMIEEMNRAVERTHRLTGMPVEEIVQRGLVRKEIPVYSLLLGLGGAGGLGGLGGMRQ